MVCTSATSRWKKSPASGFPGLESLAHHGDLSQLIAQANELIVHIDELYHNELPLIQNLI